MRKVYTTLVSLYLFITLIGCSSYPNDFSSTTKEQNERAQSNVTWSLESEGTGDILYNMYSSNVQNDYLLYKNPNHQLVIHDLKSNKPLLLNKNIATVLDSFTIFHVDSSTLYAIQPVSGTSLEILEVNLPSQNMTTYEIPHKKGEFIQAEYYNGNIICFLSGYDQAQGGILFIDEKTIQRTLKISDDYSLATVPSPIIQHASALYVQLNEDLFYKLDDHNFTLSQAKPFRLCVNTRYWIENAKINILDDKDNIEKQYSLPEPLAPFQEHLFLSDRRGDTLILGMKDGEKDHLYLLKNGGFTEIPDIQTINQDTSKFITPHDFFIFSSGHILNVYDLNINNIYPFDIPVQPITYLHITKVNDSRYRLVVIYDRTFTIHILKISV